MYSSTLSGNSTPQNCYQDNFTHQQFDIILQGSLILSQFIWGNGLSKGIMVILTLTIIINLTNHRHSYFYHHQPCHCCHHHHCYKHHCDYHLPTLSGSLVGFFNLVVPTHNFVQFGSFKFWFLASNFHVHFQILFLLLLLLLIILITVSMLN